jgi:hypothetical protein
MRTITTPRRQYAVTLGGEWEIMTTDDETRRFRPGSLVLLDGMIGRGHNTAPRATEGSQAGEEAGADPALPAQPARTFYGRTSLRMVSR